jgi:hypothetical protein
LTVEPYVIANNLPFDLATGFDLLDPDAPKETSDYFFTGGRFSGQTILVAWEHMSISWAINALLASYGGSGEPAPPWPEADYDTIWTVTLDGLGNVTVNNALCEGIDSASLPAEAPRF